MAVKGSAIFFVLVCENAWLIAGVWSAGGGTWSFFQSHEAISR
jgi:hypothetical protein